MQRQIATFMPNASAMVPRGAARLAALFFLAAIAALIAFGGSAPDLSHAAEEKGAPGSSETDAQEQSGTEMIWSAKMMVGHASDSTQAYTGYMPSRNPSEGDTVSLSLFKTVQHIAPQQLLDADGPEESTPAVYRITGELTESGQFDTIPVTLESGKRYVVEMKGAATGDGTLSDPWISGINGRFWVDGDLRREPVWYDALGRRSTSVEFPDGTQYEVDENGRVFSASSVGNGSRVLRPVSGGNDDAGEGLNARLFLVNFPGGEYQVVVSGAPNPNDTGTYTFSLMEIVSDDYSSSPAEAGELTVGGSAAGNIEAPGDVDWFAVDLEVGDHYVIRVQGQRSDAGTLTDPRFAGIFDDGGVLLEGTPNDHLAPRSLSDSRMDFTPENAGTYYVGVSGYHIYLPHRSTPPVGTYTVSVEAQE